MTSYSFPPSATICPWVRNNVIPHLSSLLAFSDFNFPPDAPTRSRSRTYIVLASADGEKQQKEAARGIETEPLEMLDLKFGHPIGENPQKTFPQVMERKSNPDVTYLEIEKSIKSVSSNNKAKRKSNGLIRPVMRREGKKDISPIEPVRLGGDAKALLMESDSKGVTHKVLLQRPYSMQKQACDFHGFAPQPTTLHLPSKKKKDSVKTSLEDTVLLRRPEAIVSNYNFRKSLGEQNTKERVTEDSLLSKTDTVNTYASAEKRGEAKRESRISMNRPTMCMNPMLLTSYEMDHRKLHGRTEDENHLQRSVSESKEDARSFPSRDPQTMGGSVPSSAKSDKMSKTDMHIPALASTSPAKMESQEIKEQLQECKVATGVKTEAEPTQWTNYGPSGIESEFVKPETVSLTDFLIHHLSEEMAVKRKSAEDLDSFGHAFINEMSVWLSNNNEDVPHTGSTLPSCRQDSGKKTDINDGPPKTNEKSFSQSNNSIPSINSYGTEGTLNQTLYQTTAVNSVLQKSLYQTDSLADGRHAIIFERNAQISDQKNGILLQAVQEGEDDDWARAESLHKSGELEEVELVSCFKSGFAVSFGSLIGFLPHRDLGPQRRYFSFEAWLQEKGPDPSTFKKDIEAECSSIFESKMSTLVSTTFLKNEGSIQSAEKKHAAMRIEEYQNLLDLYNRDRTSFFSYFVSQKTRAHVTSVDRKSGRLLFSEKLREGRDFGKKKENLMDKLNIGDVVACQVASTSDFGVFVELEGVEALIHQSELSWDPVQDVRSFLKVGEVIKAKVCCLDHPLQRINLSLKQMQPDQVLETLESVIDEENGPTKGNLELQKFENEWPEVRSLIRELELVDGIHSVSKGRLLLSPRWAPRFQVSLSDSHSTQYKILAKSGHRVQEIIIQASLNRDGIKLAILSFHLQWCEKIDGQ